MSATNKPDATQPLDLEALRTACAGADAILVETTKVLALIAEVERLRELNSVRYMNNLALDAAVGEIDKLTQYSSGNPEAQLFAVQQIVRDLRNAAEAMKGE